MTLLDKYGTASDSERSRGRKQFDRSKLRVYASSIGREPMDRAKLLESVRWGERIMDDTGIERQVAAEAATFW